MSSLNIDFSEFPTIYENVADYEFIVNCLIHILTCLGYTVPSIDTVDADTCSYHIITIIKRIQKENNLAQDGIVGPKTWKVLFELLVSHIALKPTQLSNPPKYSELNTIFGDFMLPNWYQENIGICEFPNRVLKEFSHVTYGWIDIKAFKHTNYNGFKCHKLVAPHFEDVFRTIADNNLAKHIKTFDGCYNPRLQRGSRTKWSVHSWAIAIDLNAFENKFRSIGNMNSDIVDIFESKGFTWGGRWNRSDPMHFQFCK